MDFDIGALNPIWRNPDGDYRRTILHSAAYSGSKEVVEAVTATFAEQLDDDEVRVIAVFLGPQAIGSARAYDRLSKGWSLKHDSVLLLGNVKHLVNLSGPSLASCTLLQLGNPVRWHRPIV